MNDTRLKTAIINKLMSVIYYLNCVNVLPERSNDESQNQLYSTKTSFERRSLVY